jgi:CheY-like chemotaxis protein
MYTSAVARILIADDEPTLARALARAFRSHEVVTVNSGAEALKSCTEEHFDVVICDLMMPGLTGMDVYHQLQDSGSEVCHRMVFMTGGDFMPEQTIFRKKLGARCMQKPLDIGQLRALVDSLIPA